MKFNRKFELKANQGSGQLAARNYIIIHDTGNDNNRGLHSGFNEASYMSRNWQNAYTHAIVDDEDVYIIGTPGYVAYGAGTVANGRSPMQIELAHVNSQARFNKSYKKYLEVIKYFANYYKIPLTLDTSSAKGIKSHAWVSQNIWGDHQDPWGYLAKWGVSKKKFEQDLLGLNLKKPVYLRQAKRVKAKTSVSRYRDLAFKNKVDTFKPGTLFDVESVVNYKKITRLRLSNGLYITSNTDYVSKLF